MEKRVEQRTTTKEGSLHVYSLWISLDGKRLKLLDAKGNVIVDGRSEIERLHPRIDCDAVILQAMEFKTSHSMNQ